MEIILEILHDTWMMIPLLYITYCILEIFERKDSSDDSMFYSLQKYGPLFGAIVGLIPQCGFSILASMLFLQKNITLGTLIAVMIATSDEAIPILLSNPSMYSSLIQLLISKFIIAVVVGYFVDYILERKQKIIHFEEMEDDEYEEDEQEQDGNNACPCCYTQYPLPVSALLRTLKIYGFIFITSLVLTLLIEGIGIESLERILLTNSIFQPLLTALFGFIPNCAITVVLAQLFSMGGISFGSLLAGLITNAGLGLVCLIRYGATKKEILKVFVIYILLLL
ncbi:putative manganese transporter [Floccifex sp.]|uniref:putative manganese transporter n=1 Tax=Floccifex sp. TaxID=2815810 RepID=UPI002A7637AE|nr:putative manganese transporter [Floccifex sp.]MDY2958682.1 putative manganese transporter [Floccifex sp.]